MERRRRRGLGWAAIAAWAIAGAVVSIVLWTTYDDEGKAKPPGRVTATIATDGVTLEGIVPSDSASADAEERAKALVGDAVTVTNELEVDDAYGDGPWLERYLAGLAAVPARPRPLVVSVEGGVVTVTGEAASDAEKQAVIDAITAAVAPGLTVDDRMTVAAAPTPKPAPKPAPAPAAKPKPKPAPAAKPKPAPKPEPTPKPAPAKVVADVQAQVDKALTGATIEFESGKATLTPKGKAVLDRILPALRKAPTVDLLVQGHTDAVGDPAANMTLSVERAKTVVGYLTSHGIAASRLSSAGLGETDPVASNDTEAGRLKNRRIELTVKRGG